MAGVNKSFAIHFLKLYLTRFLLVFRLIACGLVVLELLIVKICEIIGISKIEFFKCSCTERVKQNQKKFKMIENLLNL